MSANEFKPEDNSQAFDLAIAMWYWLSHWYDGMSDPKYACMCKLNTVYNLSNIPSIDFDSKEEYDENSGIIEYYRMLSEEIWETAFETLEFYLNNNWEDL